MTASSIPKPGVEEPDFKPALRSRVADALAGLSVRLAAIPGLRRSEARRIEDAACVTLEISLHRKLCRLLVVELHSARTQGRLQGETSEARWQDFLRQAAEPHFWRALEPRFPSLTTRLDRVTDNVCGSTTAFATAWAADRERVAKLLGRPAGELVSVAFAAGDPHRGGRSVALVVCEGGQLVYKPRSLAPERRLRELLKAVEHELGQPHDMAVPEVVDCGEHGWTAFVEHAYAVSDAELERFYRAMGGWLALTRLLSATDLHAENLIAHRASPVLVDAETLFTPKISPHPTGLGAANDAAMRLIAGTVIATGLLPNRGTGLAWRGVDVSGMGALAGEQPMMRVPALLDAGTDHAHIGQRLMPAEVSRNHPAPYPALAKHWQAVLRGFDTLTAILKRIDAEGRLEPLLHAFDDCEIRVVTRATEVYAELGRMLWHPVSLHKEAEARAKAADLLARMAANVSSAPDDPDVIAAEIEDLLIGDVPFFSTRASVGRLNGPGGARWLERKNLVDAALQDWRSADLERERDYVGATLANAYLRNAGQRVSRRPDASPNLDQLELRRRDAAADIVERYLRTAMLGEDGTVAWIASTLTPNGWALQPLGPDLYGGLYGIGLVLAAYVRDMDRGRAKPVVGVEDLLARVLTSIDYWEDQQLADRAQGTYVRPPSSGGYLGLGSQVWGRLAIERLTGGSDLGRASHIAGGLFEAAGADEVFDVLAGRAGAIVPLLALARASGDQSLIDLAVELGDQLLETAEGQGDTLFWRDPAWPSGLGGFAHGTTGIGWALDRLARQTGLDRFAIAADRAFRFEDELFNPVDGAWRDLRGLEGTSSSAAWCHGSVGIGLAHLDLDPALSDPSRRRRVELAVAATLRDGVGWSACACHGDVGSFELIRRARAAGVNDGGWSEPRMLVRLVQWAQDASAASRAGEFQPGLMVGEGGLLYALLQAGCDSAAPAFLTLD